MFRVTVVTPSDSIQSVEHLSIDQIYHFDTQPENISACLKYIAQYELNTFLMLLDVSHTRKEWKRRINFTHLNSKDLPGVMKLDPDNYILKMLGGDNFKADSEFLFDRTSNRVEIMTDVYEKDLEPRRKEAVLILTCDNRYLAHVYVEGYCATDRGNSLIGIRSSLYNLLSPLHNIPSIKGIGYIMLDTFNKYITEYTDHTHMHISQPIGPMHRISESYGFVDDELPAGYTSSITIPQYELIVHK